MDKTYKWVKALEELPDDKKDYVFIRYFNSPHIAIFHKKYFYVSDVNNFGLDDYYKIEWLKELSPNVYVKELPEVAALDSKLNTYVHAHGSETYVELQKLFFIAIDAINKTRLSPNVDAEKKENWKAKVEFYREQTDKLRKYLTDNNIGKPSQGFFDAILEHLQSQQPVDALQRAIADRLEVVKGFKEEAMNNYKNNTRDDTQDAINAVLNMAYGMEIKFLNDLISLQSKV